MGLAELTPLPSLIRWEVQIVRVLLWEDEEGTELGKLLDEGWEPFAAYGTAHYDYVAVRRIRP